jgi:hypothetical protein
MSNSELQEVRRREIINRIRNCITVDDVIAAVFSFLRKEEIPLDTQKIHSAFFEIKKKYPGLLNEVIFSANDVYPYSRELEKALFRLGASELISWINPDFKVLKISEKSKKFIHEKILPLFDSIQQETLKKMGELFEQLILDRL